MSRIGLLAQTACIWEATARKPGNVHRYLDFDDTSYLDYLLSAAAVAAILDGVRERGVGATILAAVQARQQVARSNTNLGILLLLAPLAAVPEEEAFPTAIDRVLDSLDLADSLAVFAGIRLAEPGGLGQAPAQDVHDGPTLPLRQIMGLAADRDLVARQYANGFREILDEGVPALCRAVALTGSVEGGIIGCHLALLANHPDSLIVRKRGTAEADEASQRARAVWEAGWPHEAAGRAALADLDVWLRAEGHSRNPGTTADLVTACLFVALRRGIITLPPQVPWSYG
jgi:triphosphoribosyl-dephospho-CoA synthase